MLVLLWFICLNASKYASQIFKRYAFSFLSNCISPNFYQYLNVSLCWKLDVSIIGILLAYLHLTEDMTLARRLGIRDLLSLVVSVFFLFLVIVLCVVSTVLFSIRTASLLYLTFYTWFYYVLLKPKFYRKQPLYLK